MVERSLLGDTLEKEMQRLAVAVAIEAGMEDLMENPDVLEPRLYKWHQFGVVTHSKMVRRALTAHAPQVLTSWEMWSNVKELLAQKIAGKPIQELLEVAALFHDFGKIVAHKNTSLNRNHEQATLGLMSDGVVHDALAAQGINEEHLQFMEKVIVASTALARDIREVLKQYQDGYTFKGLEHPDVRKKCTMIATEYCDVAVAVGIFFLCDTYGKTNVHIHATNDNEIKTQETEVKTLVKERNLHEELSVAILQHPVNIRFAQIYLEEAFKIKN